MTEQQQERDLVLAPNEYSYVLDKTKGKIDTYVGPFKTSLAGTDQLVTFDSSKKRFKPSTFPDAISPFSIAPEGWYLILKNPESNKKQPNTGVVNSLPDLDIGRKINMPGPVSIPLWPGQLCKVLRGHNLRSNQYLLVRVYDGIAAEKCRDEAIIKKQDDDDNIPTVEKYTTGQLLIIKGSEVSFYIPPTGIEIVQDENGDYIRSAASLERLEYCVLLDEDGNKQYITGPSVVFPKPTEKFKINKKTNNRVFKAVELNEISGIYIKVIAPYTEDGKEFKVGDELFITGKDQMIYFPRAEHAVIKYGDKDIHYAVAIPAGEARYVLNRITGEISLVNGPKMLLPDPRKEVIVRRILDPKTVKLWYPGNKEALDYNTELSSVSEEETTRYVSDLALKSRSIVPTASPEMDEFARKSKFTKPRTVTLDTKYEGAPKISPWTGYAVMVVDASGSRKVIKGPTTYLIEYDEYLEAMELSTGTPKRDKETINTVYLRTLNNKVSDSILAETKDLCEVNIELSYRVNFEGRSSAWFNVENYVKFLCDHMRSILRSVVKKYTIEEFYENSTEIIRNSILGIPNEKGIRSGKLFSENGMRIYDVEVLDVSMQDEDIEGLLTQNQNDIIVNTLALAKEKRKLEIQKEIENIKIASGILKTKTEIESIRNTSSIYIETFNAEMQKVEDSSLGESRKRDVEKEKQDTLDLVNDKNIERNRKEAEVSLEISKKQLEQQLELLQGNVDAFKTKIESISPGLIESMQVFSNSDLAGKLSESMAPLAMLGGKSVTDVFLQLAQGLGLNELVSGLDKKLSKAKKV